MSDKKNTTETRPDVKPMQSIRAVYTHQQIVDGYKGFNTEKVIVMAALRETDKELLTEDEAKVLIERFKNKKR
jgi:hypothetical protein